MLTVFTNQIPVGVLSRPDGDGRFRFRYNVGVDPANAVSLTMPTSIEDYASPYPSRLHPVFDQSLPEGELRNALVTMFSKALQFFDDYNLLEVVGRSQIGRLRFAPEGQPIKAPPSQNLQELLRHRGTDDLFVSLLERYAHYSGVAGVQPKVLIREDGSLRLKTEHLSDVPIGNKVTAAGTTHIVKTFDPEKFPALTLNEDFALKVAASLGLNTARAQLSDNSRFLVVERFDLKPDGSYLGFEDCCALSGRLTVDKYTGSYEQIAKLLKEFVRSPRGTKAELADFFSSLCLSVALRNGDAHRKNFGLLYDSSTEHVTLAPVFDVITTTVYVPGDTLALTLDGTKRWPAAKNLKRFGVAHCQLTPKEAEDRLESVRTAVADGAARLERDRFKEIGATDLCEQLLHILNGSVGGLSSKTSIGLGSRRETQTKKLAKSVVQDAQDSDGPRLSI